jgi:uncharacterized protein (TIGR02246 family)
MRLYIYSGDEGAEMKRISAFAAITGAVLAAASTSSAQQAGSTDEAAIRKVIVEMTDAFNNHDGKAAARMYSQDARLVSVRGEMMNTRAGIEKGLSSILTTRAKIATQRTIDVTIRFIRPDVALANVTNELSGLVAPDGQALPAHQELSLRVFVKDDGIWQVAAFHNTMIAPFAPAAR